MMNARFRYVAPRLPWILSLSCLLCASLAFAEAGSSGPNRSLKLDGRGSYVELPPNLCSNLTQATIEVWVKSVGARRYARILEFGYSWRSLSLFRHELTDDLRYNIYPRYARNNTNIQFIVLVPKLIRTKEWIHLAAVSGPGGMLLYANGRMVGEHTNTSSFASILDAALPSTNYLGRGLSGNSRDQDFLGELDEVRIWNYRRTGEQIREDMYMRLSGREPGLVHLWNFDDGTADDSTLSAANGKLEGKAVVVPSDLDLVPATPPAPPLAIAPPADVDKAGKPNTVGWWIAGALTALTIVLAWLALMFRRSGLGSARIIGAPPVQNALPAPSAVSGPGIPLGDDALKQRALAELTSFARESLVQGLFTQRAALLEAQKQAQQELVQLEARLVNLDFPDRIQAYEVRIAELERQLASRGEEVEGLANATLRLLRQKLAEEKSRAAAGSRFN